MQSFRNVLLLVAVALSSGCQSLAPPAVKQISVNGVLLKVQEQGKGPTVVMVHGGISDHRVWDLQREAIAKSHRYVSFDQRYFGPDPWPDEGSKFSFETHLDDLAAFIKELKVGAVDLVAWSYGASLALELAVHRPELVKGLFLYEPAGAFTRNVLTDPTYLAAMAEGAKGLGPAFAATRANDLDGATKLFAEWVNDQPPGSYESNTPAWVRSGQSDNARTIRLQMATKPPSAPVSCAQIGGIKVPVTVASGAQSRRTFVMLARAIGDCIRGAKHVVIPDARHSAPYTNPGAFNAAVLDFLARRP